MLLAYLYRDIFNHYASETIYQLAEANYRLHFTIDSGFIFEISGYNEKVHMVFDLIVEHVKSLPEKMEESTVKSIVEHSKKSFLNRLKSLTLIEYDQYFMAFRTTKFKIFFLQLFGQGCFPQ
jgi:secreted Zn-dependent insulinase-like peptidase